jgi:hypothetical protein
MPLRLAAPKLPLPAVQSRPPALPSGGVAIIHSREYICVIYQREAAVLYQTQPLQGFFGSIRATASLYLKAVSFDI